MSAPVEGRARFAARVTGVALGLALSACAAGFDVDRARRAFQGSEVAAAPTLIETPSAELPAPEGLRAVSGELRSVPLKWDPLLTAEAGGYAIERALDREGEFERIAVIPGRSTTSFVDRGDDSASKADADNGSGLGDGVTYFYRVSAFSPSGHLSAQSSPVAAATTAPPPAPPEGLRAFSHQPRQVPLSWRAAEDPLAAGYVIHRSPTFRGPFDRLAEIKGRFQTTFVDRNLGDLRVFYYGVSTRNAAGGEGERSQPVRAVTKPEPLPPAGLRVEAQGLGLNRLAWDPNVEEDLEGYRLLRIRDGADTSELVATLPAEEISAGDGAVSSDERVSYTVVAVDRDGLASAPAEPIAVESEGYALTATARADGVHLDWNARADEGFRGARIIRSGLFTQTELGFTESDHFVDGDVKPGRRYRYVVVLEPRDSDPAPPSSPVEILVPER
jgi:fibronectin type 3 domain-containing protein